MQMSERIKITDSLFQKLLTTNRFKEKKAEEKNIV